jgi:hypothetical protein
MQQNPVTPGKVADTLTQIVHHLEILASDPQLPREQGYTCLRYGCFADELAKRGGFCQELAAIDINGDMAVDQIGLLLRPLIEKYRFPSSRPYTRGDWAQLLTCARMEVLYFIPQILNNGWPLPRVEVQFVYEGSSGHPILVDGHSIAQAIRITLPRGLNRTQTRAFLIARCQRALRLLRRGIRRTSTTDAEFFLTVRLMSFSSEFRPHGDTRDPYVFPFAGPNTRYMVPVASVAAYFGVRVWPRRRLRGLLEEIANRLLPTLERMGTSARRPGRPPNSQDVSAWWAMSAVDGLTIPEIAARVSDNSPDSPNLEDRISKALQRLGTPGWTK